MPEIIHCPNHAGAMHAISKPSLNLQLESRYNMCRTDFLAASFTFCRRCWSFVGTTPNASHSAIVLQVSVSPGTPSSSRRTLFCAHDSGRCRTINSRVQDGMQAAVTISLRIFESCYVYWCMQTSSGSVLNIRICVISRSTQWFRVVFALRHRF